MEGDYLTVTKILLTVVTGGTSLVITGFGRSKSQRDDITSCTSTAVRAPSSVEPSRGPSTTPREGGGLLLLILLYISFHLLRSRGRYLIFQTIEENYIGVSEKEGREGEERGLNTTSTNIAYAASHSIRGAQYSICLWCPFESLL